MFLPILPGMELLRVKQVAEIMNVTVGAVYALVNAKAIPHTRVGLSQGAIRIDREDLDAYLRSRKVPVREGAEPDSPLRRTKKFTGFKHLGHGNYRPELPSSQPA